MFGALNAIFLYAVYRLRFAPTYDYAVSPRPVLNFHAQKAAFFRAFAVGLAGALASWFQTHQLNALGLGLTIGLVVGLISVIVGFISPSLEWWIEHLPDRHLAVIGFTLVAFGLLFQSVQYLVVILDLR
jgi:CHASE2 domain-containing sensor protein